MNGKYFELEVTSRMENLAKITGFVEDKLNELGLDPSVVFKVQLAVDEAATNIIRYAYPEQPGAVKLTLELEGDELTVVLKDNGVPFDINSVPPPDLEAEMESRNIGGLGVYFMKKMMDEVSCHFDERTGNQLIMKKRVTFEKHS